MKYLFLFLCLLLTASLSGLEKAPSPWLGNVYEFEPTLAYEHVFDQKIEQKKHHFSTDFVRAAMQFSPDPDWSTEVELQGTRTFQHHFGFDAARVGARYLWLNDVIGDCISLTTGVSIAAINHSHLHDVSLLHHGRYETELHAAAGKEFGFGFFQNGYFHGWLFASVGVADHSSCWTREEAHLEAILKETHFFDLFLAHEKGQGSKKLHSVHDFHGYGHIDYTLHDLGLRYSYQVRGYGSAYAKIAKRLQASNCPKHGLSYEVGVTVPFSF